MSLRNLLARLTASYRSSGERVRGRVAVARAVLAAVPRCSAEALESRVLLTAIFKVDSNSDAGDYDLADGVCDVDKNTPGEQITLRAAIQNANLEAGPSTINFALPAGQTRINILSSLPMITSPVTIDGYSQTGAKRATASTAAILAVELSGDSTVYTVHGSGLYLLNATGCRISGLAIGGFVGNAITVRGMGQNVIEGCYIGTDLTGTQPHPNLSSGILFLGANENRVGGTDPGERNVISGNGFSGVIIGFNNFETGETARNVVQGNYIGVDSSGDKELGNGWRGVRITGMAGDNTHDNVIGGTAPGEGNVISGNGWRGVGINGPGAYGNLVQGNLIGTDRTGTVAIPNGYRGDLSVTPEAGPPSGSGSPGGVVIDGSAGNTIGGLSFGAGNVISGNSYEGVALVGDANHGNLVQGNFIGTDISGTQPLGNANQGIFIYAKPGQQVRDNTIGGTDPAAQNIISANGDAGIRIKGDGCQNNVVQGNLIGTDKTKFGPLGNKGAGIAIVPDGIIAPPPFGTVIGGNGAGNVISANGSDGIFILGNTVYDTSTRIIGNVIGDAVGNPELANSGAGIHIVAAGGNHIGETGGDRNYIVGNLQNGIFIKGAASVGNSICNNSIGDYKSLDAGNAGYGVYLDGAVQTDITDNWISANKLAGLVVAGGAHDTSVHGNIIGMRITGAPLAAGTGNGGSGVIIQDSPENTIGGLTAADGNTICGNGEAGIDITGAASRLIVVTNNTIGGLDSQSKPVPNVQAGVLIRNGASSNVIGMQDKPNRISYNGGAGVAVESGNRNTIRYNSIFANGKTGIDLKKDGETQNHYSRLIDTSGEPNALLNYPVLTAFESTDAHVRFAGYYLGPQDSQYVLDFFVNGEDRKMLGGSEERVGSGSVTTDSRGWAVFDLKFSPITRRGDHIFPTATATDADGNTSEFSHDADLDGLMDSWETVGIPIKEGGVYPLVGADPFYKDVYVEVDAMQGYAPLPSLVPTVLPSNVTPTNTCLDEVVMSFLAAPVNNPNGMSGIFLHIELDPAELSYPSKIFYLYSKTWPDDFTPFKAANFGGASEHGVSNVNLRAAKQKAYRYCVFANVFDENGNQKASGISQGDFTNSFRPNEPTLGASNFMVTLGKWKPYGPNDQTGTFMHELGHTLGLQHGGSQGNDDYNFKPNYRSVMNYMFSAPMDPTRFGDTWTVREFARQWRLDYSHGGLNTLDEASLNERKGIGASDPKLLVPVAEMANPSDPKRPFLRMVPMQGQADFNGDGTFVNAPYDLTYWGLPMSTPGQVLEDQNDWALLCYGLMDSEKYGRPLSAELGIDLAAFERFAQMLADTPALPQCVADAATTPADQPVALQVLANDTVPDGAIDASSVLVVGVPAHGTTSVAADGTVTYTPDPGFDGDDSFSYVVKNMVGCFGRVATVNLTILRKPPPVVGALATDLNPIPLGYPVKLTATGVLSAQGTVAVVRFYKETNGQAGLQTDDDLLVGTDADGTDGWSVSVPGEAAPGSVTYYAQAADTRGKLSNVVSAIATVVDSPILQPLTNQTIDELIPFTFTASAIGRNGTALVFALSNGTPSGAKIDANTGVVTWTPTEAQGGLTYTFWLVARDGLTPWVYDSKSITVIVNKTNSPPVLDRLGGMTINEGSVFPTYIKAHATDTDLPTQTMTYSLGSGAPNGMTIDAVTGQISCPPLHGPASYSITFIATDNGNPPASDQQILTLTVNDVAPDSWVKPVWNTSYGLLGYQDFPFPVQLFYSDPGGDPISAWHIYWGDGTVDVLPPSATTASHTFTKTGNYSIYTSVTNHDGTFNGRSAYTTIAPMPTTGGIDWTYGSSGYRMRTTRGSALTVRDALMQPDGKLILAGLQFYGPTYTNHYCFSLTRFTDKGDGDYTFGGTGSAFSYTVETDVLGGAAQIDSIALSGTKIVAAGWATAEQSTFWHPIIAMARYDDRGRLDTSFNKTGILTLDIRSLTSEAAHGVAVQPDGKMVIVGDGIVSGASNRAIFLARYNIDGSLDPSFGTGGIRVVDFGAGMNCSANDVKLLPGGGEILVAGQFQGDFALLRFNANGADDLAFGVAGKTTTDAGGTTDYLRRIVIAADGSILAAGGAGTPGSGNMRYAIARYSAGGVLDTAFGNNGIAKIDFSGAPSSDASGLAIQPDGKIVTVGRAYLNNKFLAVVARLLPNGQLDSSFASGGLYTDSPINAASGSLLGTYAVGVAIAPGGNILVGACRDWISQFDEYVAERLITDAPTASPRIGDISPDPRTTPVPSASITFGVPVEGLDASHLSLTRNGGANLLTSAQALTGFDLTTFTLADMSSLTDLPGVYRLAVNLTGLTDLGGHALTGEVSTQWVLTSSLLVDDPGDAADAWLIRLSTDGLSIEVFRNGGSFPVSTFDLSMTGFLEFQSNGGHDTITIDSSHGNPIPAAGLLIGRGTFTLIAPDSSPFALFIDGSASVQLASSLQFSSVNLRDAAQLQASPATLLQIGNLAMDAHTRFDLHNARLILATNADADHGAAKTRILSNLVLSAINGGANRWNGPGLTSSVAKNDTNGFTTLAVLNNDDGSGSAILTRFVDQTVDANSILVKYTWNGDANLDGVINADDYFLTDSGYITQEGGWYNGDFNYDGVVNADDYFLIDSAFIGQSGPRAVSKPQSAVSADGAVQQKPRKADPDGILSQLFSTEPVL